MLLLYALMLVSSITLRQTYLATKSYRVRTPWLVVITHVPLPPTTLLQFILLDGRRIKMHLSVGNGSYFDRACSWIRTYISHEESIDLLLGDDGNYEGAKEIHNQHVSESSFWCRTILNVISSHLMQFKNGTRMLAARHLQLNFNDSCVVTQLGW